MNKNNKTWWEKNRGFVAFAIAVCLILLIGSGPFAVQWKIFPIGDKLKPFHLQWRWILIVFTMMGFLAFVGKWKTVRKHKDDQGNEINTDGRWDGIFIDSRNKISLSQFQIILWTVLALSAWSTLVLHRTIPILNHNVQNLRVLVDKPGESEPEDFKSNLINTLNDFQKKDTKEDFEDTKINSLFSLLTGEEKLPESIDSISNYDPLIVNFPEELLLAMGISTASLAGAAIIKTNKSRTESGRSLDLYKSELQNAETKLADAKDKRVKIEANKPKIQEINTKLQDTTISESTRGDLESQLKFHKEEYDLANKSVTDAQQKYDELEKADKERVGLIHVNEKVEDAEWNDMLSGEKTNDYQLLDIAKVQMFFFTIIIVFSYSVLIWAQMSTKGAEVLYWILPSVSLPAFSDSLVALLGISHVGYLSVKGTG